MINPFKRDKEVNIDWGYNAEYIIYSEEISRQYLQELNAKMTKWDGQSKGLSKVALTHLTSSVIAQALITIQFLSREISNKKNPLNNSILINNLSGYLIQINSGSSEENIEELISLLAQIHGYLIPIEEMLRGPNENRKNYISMDIIPGMEGE